MRKPEAIKTNVDAARPKGVLGQYRTSVITFTRLTAKIARKAKTNNDAAAPRHKQ